TQEMIDFINQNNPNMVISVNVLLYDVVKAVAPLYPNIWFLNTRIETILNDPTPQNVLWLEFHESIVWYLKGVLAAEFTASISTTNDYVIHVPMQTGLF